MESRIPKCNCGNQLIYLRKTLSIEERGIAEDGWKECLPPNPELYKGQIHYRNYVVEEKEYFHCQKCGAYYELIQDLVRGMMVSGKKVDRPY